MPQEEIHRLLLEHARRRAGPSCGSRAATRSCSAAAARRRSSAWRPGSRSRSCPASPRASRRRPTRASRSRTASWPPASRSSPGTRTPRKPETALDWPALAAFPGTLVFYMGVRALPRIAERLIAGGRPAGEPVAVVERGHAAGPAHAAGDARRRRRARRGGGDPRAGDHARRAGRRRCATQLAWLERRPLHGRTVAVTRARPQASALAARLRELGAAVVEAPAIRTAPLAAALPDLGGFDLVCVTSPNGAHALFERLDAAGLDARALAGRTVAAIGPGTARALREHGIRADVVPGARRRRGARRGARGGRGAARADRARARGPRRAP